MVVFFDVPMKEVRGASWSTSIAAKLRHTDSSRTVEGIAGTMFFGKKLIGLT